eukprot:TRINITY_DN9186_c0_g1_i1.p1 TRINITY_DN9186_c0_g1~~TRINITY_DN9186_c0_g1_i1.p1  ORF type:complete len:1018 (-),score=182.80 TRINITY_DN9186_c0_g1_i1:6-3059(-)
MASCSSLVEVCASGNRSELALLLANEDIAEHINETNEKGQTGLYCASLQGHIDIVLDLVVVPGIDLCTKTERGSPLHAAACAGHDKIVAILLSFGIDAYIENEYGNTAKQETTDRGVTGVFLIWEAHPPQTAIAKFWGLYPGVIKPSCTPATVTFKSLLDKLNLVCHTHTEAHEATRKKHIVLSSLLAQMWQYFAHQVMRRVVASPNVSELFETLSGYLHKKKTCADVIQITNTVYEELHRTVVSATLPVAMATPQALSIPTTKKMPKQKSSKFGSVRSESTKFKKILPIPTNSNPPSPGMLSPARTLKSSVFFEEKSACGLPEPRKYDIYDIFQKDFASREHMNFICEQELETGGSVGVAVITVAESSSFPQEIVPYCQFGTTYDVLVTCDSGQYTWSFPSLALRHKSDSLVSKIEYFLNAQAPPGKSYYHVTDTSLDSELLNLEKKHSRKHDNLKIGVIYAKENSDIRLLAEAPPPGENSKFWTFMNAMGEVINTRGWTKYLGDFASDGEDTERDTYFTQWDTVQVMYHVAPWLNEDQYRRLIGNDFLIVVFYESPQRVPFDFERCKKMGKVPHIFCVVSPCAKGEDLYYLNFFQKKTIVSFEPFSPPQGIPLTGAQVKQLLLTKLYNGAHETFKVAPLNALYTRPRYRTITELLANYPKSKQRPKVETKKKEKKDENKEEQERKLVQDREAIAQLEGLLDGADRGLAMKPSEKIIVDTKALSDLADMLGDGGLGDDLGLMIKPMQKKPAGSNVIDFASALNFSEYTSSFSTGAIPKDASSSHVSSPVLSHVTDFTVSDMPERSDSSPRGDTGLDSEGSSGSLPSTSLSPSASVDVRKKNRPKPKEPLRRTSRGKERERSVASYQEIGSTDSLGISGEIHKRDSASPLDSPRDFALPNLESLQDTEEKNKRVVITPRATPKLNLDMLSLQKSIEHITPPLELKRMVNEEDRGLDAPRQRVQRSITASPDTENKNVGKIRRQLSQDNVRPTFTKNPLSRSTSSLGTTTETEVSESK